MPLRVTQQERRVLIVIAILLVLGFVGLLLL
jgi:hypothetical protein